jgi:hypothetical protein
MITVDVRDTGVINSLSAHQESAGCALLEKNSPHLDFLFVVGNYRHEDTQVIARQVANAISTNEQEAINTRSFFLLPMCSCSKSAKNWAAEILRTSKSGIMPVIHDLYRCGYNSGKTIEILSSIFSVGRFDIPVLLFLTPECKNIVSFFNNWQARSFITSTPDAITAAAVASWEEKVRAEGAYSIRSSV